MRQHTIEREEIEQIYGEISPFELREYLIQMANQEKNEKSARTLLDAGRGNPNWTALTPREAYFSFGQFATLETTRYWKKDELAGMPNKDGIANRFYDYLNKNTNNPGSNLLKQIIDYGINTKGFNPDDWVYELTDGIIGDNYPSPNRMLTHLEEVVKDYLTQELYYHKEEHGPFHVYAVEGATAAMCYLFDSLVANHLLSKGDKVALMVPIFTPYLEIPVLPRYDFDVINIEAKEITENEVHQWIYPKEEIEKLLDKKVKALFIVNPGNPSSEALKKDTIEEIVTIVKEKRTDLMIISDDVYGTFVDEFHSLVGELPYNSIGVYSYSKYFGATGWRLGTIALHDENIFNQLIENLPNHIKQSLNKRYESLTTHPEELGFLDRIIADSRQVALKHTAGLSTPQQVQMAFFSIFALLDKENNYKNLTKRICRHRKELLFEGLGLNFIDNRYDADYYVQFNLQEWAYYNYGEKFANYLITHYKPIDILIQLAEEYSIVLMNGGGFHGSKWSIRISLANLRDEDYSKIGHYLHQILNNYSHESEKLLH